jgi:AcrR family transcriptional regulator
VLTRCRIVEAAAGLMFTRGIASTSMDQVRAEAGVSGSQLALYFADKRALVRAVIAWQSDRVIEFNTKHGSVALDSFEALRDWADRHIEMQQALDFVVGCRLGALAGQLGACDELTRTELAIGFDRWTQVVRDGLEAMRARGLLCQGAPIEQLTTMLVAAHQGGALVAQAKRDVTPLREALDGALDYIASFAAT